MKSISIHALREEGDRSGTRASLTPTNFYPRPPRGGRRLSDAQLARLYKFLSTPSARRATVQLVLDFTILWISIHALREEGDYIERGSALSGWRFLSTPSARRATKAARLTSRATRISIHALREEGDAGSGDQGIGLGISIHALREEGDQGGCPERVRDFISIHALREEGDWIAEAALLPVSNFYPRPPRGGRHQRRS